jgi:mono/diheme cytochrome c family protein
MRRTVTFALALAGAALALAGGAAGGVEIVPPFPPAGHAGAGAIGLAVPGAGPTVTRQSALNTLLTGEVSSSLVGGTPPGEPRLELDDPAPPRVLVTLPPAGRSENDERYPIAVLGAGFRGVLTSDSTRIDGLVSLADVANGRLRWVAAADPVATLERLEARIDRNDRIRLPLTILLVATAIVAALAAPRLAPRVFLLALAANLWLAGWWAVALVGLAAALLPLGLACAAVVGAYLLVLGLDPEAVALSPLGPSQAGRFYGLSNLLATALLVPALLGAALLGRLGILVAVASLLAVGGNRFGADGGGLLVLLAGYGVLALRLAETRITPRRALALAGGVVLAGLALVGLDAALGGSSHVTDAVGDGPLALLGEIAERIELSVRRVAAGVGPLAVVLSSLVLLAGVATRRPRTPVTDALLAALAVSLVVNDTPSDVLAVGAAAALALRRYELAMPRTHATGLDRLRAMRRVTTTAALLAAALALAAAGCGGEEVTATPETVVGEIPTETGGGADLPALELEGDAAAGAEVFTANACGSCHTLAAAGASGNVGPNLDETKPSYELAVERITLGQGGMPAFGDKLEPQQIADVSQYIVESAGG